METREPETSEINAVVAWFGDAFDKLHPQLQELHRAGGNLTGKIHLSFGKGLAGMIGKRLAKRLGIPSSPGEYAFRVEIRHGENDLHWDRHFAEGGTVSSLFRPVGKYPRGCWQEKTGPVNLALTVDIIDQGWHWRLLGASIHGLPLPLFLFPCPVAYKRIVGTEYQFHVSFSMPWFGKLLSYEGLLQPDLRI